MNVLFKCDKSEKIGLGHYYRCLALSEVFKKKGHKCFFLGLKPGIKKKNNISLRNQNDDISFTKKFIKKNKIKIVIKDIYGLNYLWEKKIRKIVFLTVIDDLRKKKHFCNIYINYHYNFFQKSHQKLLNKDCRKLIGLNFVIFRNFKLDKKKKKKNLSIFFYMGGADNNMKMLELIDKMNDKKFDKYKKIFLLNKNHIKNKNLISKIRDLVNFKVFKNRINNFHNILRSSNLVISSGGVTMYEQILLRSNPVIIPQNFNQIETAKPLSKIKEIHLIQNVKKELTYKNIHSYLFKRRKRKTLLNKKGKYLIYKNIISDFKKNLVKI